MVWGSKTHLPCPVALVLSILQSRESTFFLSAQLRDYSGKVEKTPLLLLVPRAKGRDLLTYLCFCGVRETVVRKRGQYQVVEMDKGRRGKWNKGDNKEREREGRHKIAENCLS